MRVLVLLAALALQAPGPVYAYVETEVRDGGVLAGRVRYRGERPAQKFLPVLKNHDVCGAQVPDLSLVVSGDGGLRNAVVELEGIPVGKPLPKGAQTLDNKACSFEPRVQTLAVGQPLLLKNSDPILHDAHAWLGSRTVFNLGLPPWRRVSHQFDQPGLHSVDCNVLHTWMKAWVFVSEHPYVAVTNQSGRFLLNEIPPGRYRLRVWHELLGTRALSVDVIPNARTEATIEYSVP